MPKTALITGITGQDGSYLAELLLEKGYIVHGLKRRSSSFNTQRIDHLFKDRHFANANIFLHYGDLSDSTNLIRIIQETQPDEIYNLGAMSHVHVSFDTPEYSANSDGIGTLRMLEAIRILGKEKEVRFYQASTSELYGKVEDTPQTEKTKFYPRSPYAVAKLYAYWITINYREAYGMYACNGILFNHESPRRGETFVTRKITRGIASIVYGLSNKLYLGNIDNSRDWGHAKDYVRAMHLMLQQQEPEDLIIATGTTHTVRQFLLKSFEYIGVKIDFVGKGLGEKGVVSTINKELFKNNTRCKTINIKPGQTLIEIKKEYFRPTDVKLLLGDASVAEKKLGWKPTIGFSELSEEMMRHDLYLFKERCKGI